MGGGRDEEKMVSPRSLGRSLRLPAIVLTISCHLSMEGSTLKGSVDEAGTSGNESYQPCVITSSPF